MKGTGVGQRPQRVKWIIINFHDQLCFICSKFVNLQEDFFFKGRRKDKSNTHGCVEGRRKSGGADVGLAAGRPLLLALLFLPVLPEPGQERISDNSHEKEKGVLLCFGPTGQRWRTREQHEERRKRQPLLSSSLCKRGAWLFSGSLES